MTDDEIERITQRITERVREEVTAPLRRKIDEAKAEWHASPTNSDWRNIEPQSRRIVGILGVALVLSVVLNIAQYLY